jgi:hypothetical protein
MNILKFTSNENNYISVLKHLSLANYSLFLSTGSEHYLLEALDILCWINCLTNENIDNTKTLKIVVGF